MKKKQIEYFNKLTSAQNKFKETADKLLETKDKIKSMRENLKKLTSKIENQDDIVDDFQILKAKLELKLACKVSLIHSCNFFFY